MLKNKKDLRNEHLRVIELIVKFINIVAAVAEIIGFVKSLLDD